jgi:CTP synthase (UTP-ammonia lyase)
MPIPARLAIVGDFDAEMYTHRAIDDALSHVRQLREHALEWSWIGTSALAVDAPARLATVDAVWLAPGSPYQSMEGALSAVRIARERALPFLGVCGGFPVIAALSCSLVGKSGAVFLDPTCRTAAIYGRWRVVEHYHCSYGLNPVYRQAIERAGLHVVGEDDHGEARVVELHRHPFFIATLFQPQLASTPGAPAPLVRALVDAAIHFRDRRATPGSTEIVVSGRA